jgi:DNA-binding CsgD family transcriptional regulator
MSARPAGGGFLEGFMTQSKHATDDMSVWRSLSDAQRQMIELTSQGFSGPVVCSRLRINLNVFYQAMRRARARVGSPTNDALLVWYRTLPHVSQPNSVTEALIKREERVASPAFVATPHCVSWYVGRLALALGPQELGASHSVLASSFSDNWWTRFCSGDYSFVVRAWSKRGIDASLTSRATLTSLDVAAACSEIRETVVSNGPIVSAVVHVSRNSPQDPFTACLQSIVNSYSEHGHVGADAAHLAVHACTTHPSHPTAHALLCGALALTSSGSPAHSILSLHLVRLTVASCAQALDVVSDQASKNASQRMGIERATA